MKYFSHCFQNTPSRFLWREEFVANDHESENRKSVCFETEALVKFRDELELSLLQKSVNNNAEEIPEEKFVKGRKNWRVSLGDANWNNEYRIPAKDLDILAKYISDQVGDCYTTDKLALLYDEDNNPYIVIKRGGELIYYKDIPLKGKVISQVPKTISPQETKETSIDIPISYEKYGTKIMPCEEIKIEKGDSVFTILQKKRWVDPNKEDLIAQIKEINKLDSKLSLKAGETIKIPIWCYSGKRIDMIYRKANVKCIVKKGDTVYKLYNDISSVSTIHNSVSEFSDIFQKVNRLESPGLSIGKEYTLPGVISLKIAKGQGLHQLLNSHGFYADKSVHQDIFDFNKQRNPEFENIKNTTSIPEGVNIWVSLGLLATGDESKDNEKDDDKDKDKKEVVPQGTENFQKWFDSIEVKNKSLKNLYIVLDPGHGAKTRNTSKLDKNNPNKNENKTHEYDPKTEVVVNEHEIVYDVSLRLLKKLKENGAHVITTVIDKNQETGQIRNGNVLPDGFSKTSIQGKPDEVFWDGRSIPKGYKGALTKDFNTRLEIVKDFFDNQEGVCELFLVLHADARLQNGNGGMGWLYPPKTGGFPNKKQRSNDESFALTLLEQAKANGIKSPNKSGYKNGKLISRNTYVLRRSEGTADARVYLEIGDMLEPGESYLLRTGEYRQKIADVLFEGIKKQYENSGFGK